MSPICRPEYGVAVKRLNTKSRSRIAPTKIAVSGRLKKELRGGVVAMEGRKLCPCAASGKAERSWHTCQVPWHHMCSMGILKIIDAISAGHLQNKLIHHHHQL